MSNSAGSRQFEVLESAGAMMAAYDRLPRIVRDVFKYARANYAVVADEKNVARALKSGKCAHDIARIIAAGLRKHEAEECYRTYGPDHPQSDSHGRRLRPNHLATWGG